MTELWIKLSDTGWGYRPGHETAHFMLHYNGPEVYGWVSACGQVLASPEDTPFKATSQLMHCGRCNRSLNVHPDWQPTLMTGFWSPAIGSGRQHQWLWDGAQDVWVSRCGVVRSGDAVGWAGAEDLTAAGVSSSEDLPDCKKCLDYLGIDERKRPETVHTGQDGTKVSVKMMAGVKAVYDVGQEFFRIENKGDDPVDFLQILLPVDEAGVIMDDLIQAALTYYIEYRYDGVIGFSRSFLCIPSEDQNVRKE